MNDYRGWSTLREIDQALGLDKGSAFRAFKQVEPGLKEGADFKVLAPATERDDIEILRSAGRIYAGSVNVVLLAPHARAQVAALAQ